MKLKREKKMKIMKFQGRIFRREKGEDGKFKNLKKENPKN